LIILINLDLLHCVQLLMMHKNMDYKVGHLQVGVYLSRLM